MRGRCAVAIALVGATRGLRRRRRRGTTPGPQTRRPEQPQIRLLSRRRSRRCSSHDQRQRARGSSITSPAPGTAPSRSGSTDRRRSLTKLNRTRLSDTRSTAAAPRRRESRPGRSADHAPPSRSHPIPRLAGQSRGERRRLRHAQQSARREQQDHFAEECPGSRQDATLGGPQANASAASSSSIQAAEAVRRTTPRRLASRCLEF